MPDTTLPVGRRESVREVDGHGTPVHRLPDGCHDGSDSDTDRNLSDAAARAPRTSGPPALRSLDIEISGGIVILWGRVPSYYQKQLAQETVQRVDGVQGIANGIEVVCYR